MPLGAVRGRGKTLVQYCVDEALSGQPVPRKECNRGECLDVGAGEMPVGQELAYDHDELWRERESKSV